MKFVTHIKETLSLDYRSLALYRFFLGIIVIVDVLYRLPNVVNFYTDVGLIPRSLFVGEMAMPWSFSLHLANGSSAFAFTMFVIQLLFGIMLSLGYKTRWATIGAFVMCVSVHNRNWLVNNGGDDIMRSLLFLSIFLPLNRVFSIDSALRINKEKSKETEFSLWGIAFFLQVFAIYFVSYILKDSPIWRTDFTATFISSRLEIFATPIGVWMRNYPQFLKSITFFSIYLEFLGPLLLIFSFVLGRFWWFSRVLLVCLFWGFHLGIIFTMWIGVFPYLCLVMWLIFLPTPFWNLAINYFKKMNFHQLTIYFDGECGFCHKAVLTLKEFFLLSQVEILPAQSSDVIHQQMTSHHSWVVVDDMGISHFEGDAVLAFLRHSPSLSVFAPLCSLKAFRPLLNLLYRQVANHRALFSQLTQFFEFTTQKKRVPFLRFFYELAGGFIFLTLLFWNLSTIKKINIQASFFKDVTRWVHLYQEWNMFAPFPKMDNIWVEIPATLSDGSQIELLTGDRDIYEMKDQKFPKLIPDEHWRKFYLNLSEKVDNARYYGGFLCRSWNERHIQKVKDTTLRKLEIIVYSRPINLDGSEGGVSRKLSWKHWCFADDYEKEKDQE